MPPSHRLIAIETSSSPGSVAIGTKADGFIEQAFPPGGDHGRSLVPALVGLATAAGWQLAAADLVAVAIGPGPFTGLRVGVTTAKAIAWAAGCEIVAVPTAACLAAQAVSAGSPFHPVHVVFDAGRGELYAVTASPSGSEATAAADMPWQLQVTGLVTPEAWQAGLPEGATVTGPGLASAAPLLAALADTRPDLRITPTEQRQPTATTVAQLGLAAAERDETLDAAAVVPIYLRASYAEEKKG